MHGLYGWRGAFLGAAALGARRRAGAGVQPGGEPHPAGKPRAAASGADRLAAAADRADPDELRVLHDLRVRQLRLAELSRWWRSASSTARARSTANTALSGYLLMSALGVLIGGWIAGRMTQHRLTAALGLSATVLAAAADRQRRSRRAAAGPGDVARRPVQRHGDAVARHDRARSDAAGLVRQGVRLRHHRLPHRRHPRAAAVRRAARPRRAARDLLHRSRGFTLLAIVRGRLRAAPPRA